MLDSRHAWVAVMTFPNAETKVADNFENAEPPIEYYLPMMAVKDRRRKLVDMQEKPMFPGYIFAHINNKQVYQTRTTKGVMFIVSSQHSIVKVPDKEIEAVRKFEATKRKFFTAATSSLVKGAKVTVLEGEFAGMEGTLLKGNRNGNFCVNISVMNVSIIVHLKRSELRPTAVSEQKEES